MRVPRPSPTRRRVLTRVLAAPLAAALLLTGCQDDEAADSDDPPAAEDEGAENGEDPPENDDPTDDESVDDDTDDGDDPADDGDSVVIELSAENVSFDQREITVPAGATVTVEFENRDTVEHNFSVYETEAGDEPVFQGDVIGEGSITYEFTAPNEPGTYHFRCDPHPQQMTGDFIVE